MINQQLLDYVRQQLATGVSKEEISKSLIAAGWQASDVNEALNQVTAQRSSAPLSKTNLIPTQIPVNVRRFERLMYIALSLGLAMSAIQITISREISSFSALIMMLIPVGSYTITASLVWLAAHRRKNWARWALGILFRVYVFYIPLITFDTPLVILVTVIFTIKILFSLPSIFLASFAMLWPLVLLVLRTAVLILGSIAIYYVFSSTANAWFTLPKYSESIAPPGA